MKKINIQELKIIQIEILNNFDSFCKANGINYWLDFGTLLGAVRHRGFIPWDDDVDIAMLRDDYERAAALFNRMSDGRYIFQTPTTDKTMCYPFGKLLDTQTVLYEYGKSGIKTCVYVDVFVYDNSPNDQVIVKKMLKKRDFLGRLRRLKLPMRKDISLFKKILYLIGHILLLPFSMNTINRALDKNARQYTASLTTNVSNFVNPYDSDLTVVKSLFQNLTDVEFEGKLYPAPKDYDVWLTKLYGNYMQLPPVDQRGGHHVIDAYFIC